jgi:Tol biopolymer transport system component
MSRVKTGRTMGGKAAALVVLAALAGLVVVMASSGSAATGETTRVSLSSSGEQGNGSSKAEPSISADGRYVAFYSEASTLVAGDTNNNGDVFVHDRQTNATERVSVAGDGAQANGSSGVFFEPPSISADGRYVAFESFATNLVPGDTNDRKDAFVRDRQQNITTRVSVAGDGTQGNFESFFPQISADGRYVAFRSEATNLVVGDTNSSFDDIFVHDRQTGDTTRVSVASGGTQANGESRKLAISADGRYVAFMTDASNLVAGDTNGLEDVFVRDRQNGTTERASVASDGTQANNASQELAISADGRYVAFESFASNLVATDTNGAADIFIRDRQNGATTRASVASDGTQGNGGGSFDPSISANGRYVAFTSSATNLVADANGRNHVFVRDLHNGDITQASVASDGTQGNGSSRGPSSPTDDGHLVAFTSDASNLVAGDTNFQWDVFARDTGGANAPPVAVNDAYSTNENQPLSIPTPGVLGNDADPDGDTLAAIKVSDPSSGALTLNPNGSFAYAPDAGFSGTDTFTYKANDGQADGNVATATITVQAGSSPPALTINDVSIREGNGGTKNAVFTVRLDAPPSQQVTVDYATANGSAKAPKDYVSTSGTLTFATNDAQETLSVAVKGDRRDERNEAFFVNLSGAANATVADAQGRGKIRDND